ncbi:MAG TPA: FHA domain-containing protein [Kofleriaceae bacterium]|nr:FHA domain-containing protein [Kofleriaceae bacterium]
MLCEECCDELSSPIVRVMPEQLQLHSEQPMMAALIDLFGHPHPLDPSTLIGRQVETAGLAILEPSVSRQHARITLEGDTWMMRDLSSANGTYQDDRLIEGAVPLREGERIRFGQIAFYFIEDITKLPEPLVGRTSTVPIGDAAQQTVPDAPAQLPPRPQIAGTLPPLPPQTQKLPDPDEFPEEERTDVGLPVMTFKLHEPTGGGGGVVEVDGKQVQLTTTQFELMALMVRRMAAEAHQPELVRGFVRSSELIADLSWDTREPSENHVKQLVRRVRRALMKSEIGDLIESRHRFGYRLRAIPRAE